MQTTHLLQLKSLLQEKSLSDLVTTQLPGIKADFFPFQLTPAILIVHTQRCC